MKPTLRRILTTLLGTGLAAGLLVSPAVAQPRPVRPVRLPGQGRPIDATHPIMRAPPPAAAPARLPGQGRPIDATHPIMRAPVANPAAAGRAGVPLPAGPAATGTSRAFMPPWQMGMNSPLPGTAGAAAPAAAAAPATGTVAPNLMGTNPYMQGANTFNPYANLNGTGSYLTSYAGLPGMGLPFGPLGTAGQANANLGRAKLDWPLGLRILPPAEETKGLRQEIEIFVRQALGQAAAGKVSDKVVKEAGKDIDRLSTLLARHAGQLPVSEYTITESKRFLRQLKKTLKELE